MLALKRALMDTAEWPMPYRYWFSLNKLNHMPKTRSWETGWGSMRGAVGVVNRTAAVPPPSACVGRIG